MRSERATQDGHQRGRLGAHPSIAPFRHSAKREHQRNSVAGSVASVIVEMTVNQDWLIGSSDWFNYTRDFRLGTTTCMRLCRSMGGCWSIAWRPPAETGDPTQAGQTVEDLTTLAPGTQAVGGWCDELVPGKVVTLWLPWPCQARKRPLSSGQRGLRLLGVCSGGTFGALKITKIQVLADKRITIEWEGGRL